MIVFYLNNEYRDEETILKEHGIQTKRIRYPIKEINEDIERVSIFRGPKLNKDQYRQFLESIDALDTLVDPEQYGMIADAEKYSQCFEEYSPKVLSFSIDEPVEMIKTKLQGVKLPLFVRSNVESAAKYVGVEACFLRKLENLEEILKPIYEHIKTADSIIMKEVVPLKVVNNRSVEYRAIVISDKLVCFDYDPSSELPDPMNWQWNSVIDTASQNGLHGAYFLDLGVDIFDRLFVVECKNLINGTIKQIDLFAEGLKKLC